MQKPCHIGRSGGGQCSTVREEGDEVREVDGALFARIKNLDFILSETGNHWRVLSSRVIGPNLHGKRIILLRQL